MQWMVDEFPVSMLQELDIKSTPWDINKITWHLSCVHLLKISFSLVWERPSIIVQIYEDRTFTQGDRAPDNAYINSKNIGQPLQCLREKAIVSNRESTNTQREIAFR